VAQANAFLGRGWSFPPAFDKAITRGAEMVEGVADIEQSIRLILGTTPGERTMLPVFGCPLRGFLFRKVDLSTETMIRDAVSYALLHYEPRIVVNAIQVSGTQANEGQIDVAIDYTVRATNSRANMVYPYCKVEGTLLLNPP